MNALFIILLVLGLLAGLSLILRLLQKHLQGLQRRGVKEIMQKLGDEGILSIASNANCFGRKSKGVAQIRGNGIWVLTPKRIHFAMLAPRRVVDIELQRVIETCQERSFLGKRVGRRPVLVVRFTDETGKSDAVGWLLSDVEKRRRMIDQAVQSAKGSPNRAATEATD